VISAIRHQHVVIIGDYRDEGISGSRDSRPALDRLMKDARCRKFDVVIVARFDRFARSVSHLLRALEEFSHLGVDFVSLSESIDTCEWRIPNYSPFWRAVCIYKNE
jgi:DNA invertase Pin-like site-specific DNA recombinase